MSAHALPRPLVRFKRPRWPRWSWATRFCLLATVWNGGWLVLYIVQGSATERLVSAAATAVAAGCFEFCRRLDKHDDDGGTA